MKKSITFPIVYAVTGFLVVPVLVSGMIIVFGVLLVVWPLVLVFLYFKHKEELLTPRFKEKTDELH